MQNDQAKPFPIAMTLLLIRCQLSVVLAEFIVQVSDETIPLNNIICIKY